ncbi:acetyltransferase [Paenibacillus alkalitolerans]|uniref:acetyltransferase n=1 Tax=Paenibacillus alkalitolerans TaxID=2799335 RepID=UPI0018F60913|nr:acetyltransferase [Paenibacillus alkalitolerans]
MNSLANRKVAVIGYGGHAKVLMDSLELLNADIACVVLPERDGSNGPYPAITDEEFPDIFPVSDILLVNGIGAASIPTTRRKVFERYKSLGYGFAAVVHPAAIVSKSAIIEEGAQVMAGAVIQPSASIGANVIVNTRASVDHDCVIGIHSHIAVAAVLSGNVTIGQEVLIGAGAVVMQGVRIGRESVVGAGAVVTRDLPPYITAVGVPAKELRRSGDR